MKATSSSDILKVSEQDLAKEFSADYERRTKDDSKDSAWTTWRTAVKWNEEDYRSSSDDQEGRELWGLILHTLKVGQPTIHPSGDLKLTIYIQD